MTYSGVGLTRWQAFALQVVIPIALIGIVLPIGLPALILGLDGTPLEDAINHGELFLAAGNMSFTGCVVLVAMRPDRALTVSIFNSLVFGGVVMPSYLGWVHIATSVTREAEYSTDAAVRWGLVALAAALLATSVLTAYAFIRPSPAKPPTSVAESATLQN